MLPYEATRERESAFLGLTKSRFVLFEARIESFQRFYLSDKILHKVLALITAASIHRSPKRRPTACRARRRCRCLQKHALLVACQECRHKVAQKRRRCNFHALPYFGGQSDVSVKVAERQSRDMLQERLEVRVGLVLDSCDDVPRKRTGHKEALRQVVHSFNVERAFIQDQATRPSNGYNFEGQTYRSPIRERRIRVRHYSIVRVHSR